MNCPEHIKDSLRNLRICFDNAPVDFLGTGSDSKFADAEEKDWREMVDKALNDITEYITNGRGLS